MLAYGLPRIIRFRVSLISKQSAVSTGHFAYAACAHRSTEGARQQPPPKLRTLAVAAAAATLTAALCGTRGQEPWCDATPATCIDHVMPAVDEIFRAEKESAHIPGILYGVMQDGKLIHSVALGMADVEKSSPVDLTTRFKIASMSKSFTALAILQLRDRGVLSLDDPVARFIPLLRQLPATARAGDYPALTLRHLLTHAGGMPQEDPWVCLSLVCLVISSLPHNVYK